MFFVVVFLPLAPFAVSDDYVLGLHKKNKTTDINIKNKNKQKQTN